MIFSGVVHPEQLAMLTRVLNDYCREHDIKHGSMHQADAASMIVALYRHGYQTADDLKDALNHEWLSNLVSTSPRDSFPYVGLGFVNYAIAKADLISTGEDQRLLHSARCLAAKILAHPLGLRRGFGSYSNVDRRRDVRLDGELRADRHTAKLPRNRRSPTRPGDRDERGRPLELR